MKNLVIAAHPDDEILGCGGTIAKLCNSEDFYVLILTGGAEGRYSKDMEKQLHDNAISANKIIGTKEVFFEKLPNQALDSIPLTSVIQIIEKYVNRLKPETIFIHSSGDLNKDHRIVFEAGVTAARPMPEQIIKKVYTYFVASSTEWSRNEEQFMPNTFVDIKNTIEKKITAMKCYLSECRSAPHPRSPEALTIYASYLGISSGYEHAEPFQLIQNISGDL